MTELMIASDVAKLIGVTPATVRTWADAGRLPALRTVSGMRLFDRHDVEHLARERQAASDRKAGVGDGALEGCETIV
jgi:excisionase family DNA binding protein